MTAPILSVFGTVAVTDEQRRHLAQRAMVLLRRTVSHRFQGQLWERIAEGKTR